MIDLCHTKDLYSRRMRISYVLALIRVARFYATTEQNVIHSFWNALRIRRKSTFPPLIKAGASSTNCTMGNLTCSRHATYRYIQSMLNLARFISFLLYKSLVILKRIYIGKVSTRLYKFSFLMLIGGGRCEWKTWWRQNVPLENCR